MCTPVRGRLLAWQSAVDWDYTEAAVRGSSYLKLPRLLEFFTGHIGFHHVHHLNARIPNYHLRRAHRENSIFHQVPELSLLDGLPQSTPSFGIKTGRSWSRSRTLADRGAGAVR